MSIEAAVLWLKGDYSCTQWGGWGGGGVGGVVVTFSFCKLQRNEQNRIPPKCDFGIFFPRENEYNNEYSMLWQHALWCCQLKFVRGSICSNAISIQHKSTDVEQGRLNEGRVLIKSCTKFGYIVWINPTKAICDVHMLNTCRAAEDEHVCSTGENCSGKWDGSQKKQTLYTLFKLPNKEITNISSFHKNLQISHPLFCILFLLNVSLIPWLCSFVYAQKCERKDRGQDNLWHSIRQNVVLCTLLFELKASDILERL